MEGVTTMAMYTLYKIIDYKEEIKDPKILFKYLGAFMLGDGGVYMKNHNLNAYYSLGQREDHLDYIEWVSSIIANITSVRIYYVDQSVNQSGYKNSKNLYRIESKSHPKFTTIRNRFYIEGRKVVSPHDLKLFDWESAAIWHVEDGTLSVTPRKTMEDYYRVRLSTESFSYGDNLLLKQALKEKLGVLSEIGREVGGSGNYHYRIRMTKDNAKRFIEGIYPFIEKMAPSYMYKVKAEQIAPIVEGDDIVSSI